MQSSNYGSWKNPPKFDKKKIIFHGKNGFSSDTFQINRMMQTRSLFMLFERKHMLSINLIVYTLISQVFLLYIETRYEHYITRFVRLGIYVLND